MKRIYLLIGVAVGAVCVALMIPPIAQDPGYHNFADQREWWRIPNFWNVVSNVPIAMAGLYGVWVWRRSHWQQPGDRWPWLVIALAAILVGIGSGYYHWRPNNQTLFWDRLPMTLVFMGLFAVAIAERIHARWGLALFLPFVLLGILSVEVWRRGELTGVGDLRFYALVQFYPSIALPLILWLFPSRYTHGGRLWRLGILYLFAKLAEGFDRSIYAWTSNVVSGHTIKHFLAAWALWEAFRMLGIRRPAQ